MKIAATRRNGGGGGGGGVTTVVGKITYFFESGLIGGSSLIGEGGSSLIGENGPNGGSGLIG